MDKKVLNIVIALMMGVAAVGIYVWSTQQQPQISGEEDLVAVLVAARNLGRGEKIDRADIGVRRVSRRAVEPGTFLSSEAASVIGKRAVIDIKRGQYITEEKVVSADRISSLAMKVPAGKRAVTIPVDRFSSFEGLIRPNDYVDIVGIFKLPQKVENQVITQNVVVPLFQKVQVLAVGSTISRYEGVQKADTVTLALDPWEGELLSFALEQGQVKLCLRSPLDANKFDLPSVGMEAIWNIIFKSVPKPSAPPEKKPEVVSLPEEPEIEIYRGGNIEK